MKYIQIYFLNFQRAFVHRGETFLYIGMSVLNPLTMIFLWHGAFLSADKIGSLTLTDINTYFLVLILLNNLISVHIEEKIATRDIQQGGILGHLMRPMSYFWQCFAAEFSYRSFQAFVVILAMFVLIRILHIEFIHPTLLHIVQFSLCAFIALFISFTYKFIMGISAFWLTDTNGLFSTLVVLELVFGGFIMPLELYPEWLQTLAHFSPYPYMYYYPYKALVGKLSHTEFASIFMLQLVILGILAGISYVTWNKGVKKFTAVGQ